MFVGGYAFAALVHPRTTGDIDFFISNEKENAEKVLNVIEEFGMGSLNIKLNDLTSDDCIIQIGFPLFRIDIINSISGVSFEEVWVNKIRTSDLGTESNIIGFEEFIKYKIASGRPKDIADVVK